MWIVSIDCGHFFILCLKGGGRGIKLLLSVTVIWFRKELVEGFAKGFMPML